MVLLRVFIVINIAAYFLATKTYFENEIADGASLFVIYALESGFMLWLGFKRGVGFRRSALASMETSTPARSNGPSTGWYMGVMALSLVCTVSVALIGVALNDDGAPASVPLVVLWFIEAMVMGFALLQGLRIGWHAMAIQVSSQDSKTLTAVQEAQVSKALTLDLVEERENGARKRAGAIRRGQIALGCISVICAGLAIYFHLVAHEAIKPDLRNDAAIQAVVQGLDDSAPSTTNVHQATKQDVLPPDDPRVSDTLAKAAQVATESGVAQDLAAFPFPAAAGTRSPDGYPIYLLECNVEANSCFGGEGQAYGTIAKTADQLTPIRNNDAMRYKCIQRVCVDTAGNYVGAISSVVQAYWEAHHAPLHEFGK